MRYDQLEHAIRAACDVSGDTELLIFGSQAILGSYPDAPGSLRASIEVDVQSKNRPEMTDYIDGALGEDSQFHASQPGGNKGLCIEAHDLAASKLVAYREKDRVFVATLLNEGLIDWQTLLERIAELPVTNPTRERLIKWVEFTVAEIGEVL